MSNPIQLIVGLGNPGQEYSETRHNAGVWLVELLANNQHQSLRFENKFHGFCEKIHLEGVDCRLLIPTTFMNNSGKAVQAVANFYRITPESLLVVHDDLDLPVGVTRFKLGGGDGGHNGLRDITSQLGSKDYWRLRIGIGHPGSRERVHDYVLSKASKAEHQQMISAIEQALIVLPLFVQGEMQKATQQLHTS